MTSKGREAIDEAIGTYENISDERLGGSDLDEAMAYAEEARRWADRAEAIEAAARGVIKYYGRIRDLDQADKMKRFADVCLEIERLRFALGSDAGE